MVVCLFVDLKLFWGMTWQLIVPQMFEDRRILSRVKNITLTRGTQHPQPIARQTARTVYRSFLLDISHGSVEKGVQGR